MDSYDDSSSFESAKEGDSWGLEWKRGSEEFTARLKKHHEFLLLTECHWGCIGGVARTGCRWQYDKYGEIVLPVKWIKYNLDEDGRLVDSRDVQMVSGEVNNAVSEETFSLGSLGPVDGDRVLDRLSGETKILIDGEFLPIREAAAALANDDKKTIPERISRNAMLIIGNALIVVCLIGYFLVSRTKSSCAETK